MTDASVAEGKWRHAFIHYKRAAAAGNADAMCSLANVYMFSYRAVPVDWQKADELISKATELKAADAPLWQGMLMAERGEYACAPDQPFSCGRRAASTMFWLMAWHSIGGCSSTRQTTMH